MPCVSLRAVQPLGSTILLFTDRELDTQEGRVTCPDHPWQVWPELTLGKDGKEQSTAAGGLGSDQCRWAPKHLLGQC